MQEKIHVFYYFLGPPALLLNLAKNCDIIPHMAKSIYDLIKKQNGEHFAQAIRNYDSGIFDVPNIVDIVKYAGRDATPILKYLEFLKTRELNMDSDAPAGDPFKLLHRAGYHAVYADTLEKQNDIKKYFAPGEELCTFKDTTRYQNYYIVNAVRYDVDKIRRADFQNPAREDAYGTSVMSIQMAKQGGFISIKNRYNHTVEHPDNTYNSNPDNIIYGLSAALMQYFDIEFNVPNELPDGYVLVDNHVVRYKFEMGGIYFCHDFYVKYGEIRHVNKSYEILVDNFVVDLRGGTRPVSNIIIESRDSFPAVINHVVCGKKLSVTKPDADGTVHIFADGAPLMDVRDGVLVGLNLPEVQVIPDNFLAYNQTLEKINLSSATAIGNSFLSHNTALQSIDVHSAKTIGDGFLCSNTVLQSIDVRNAETIGDDFLYSNTALVSIDVSNAEKIGDEFLFLNTELRSIDAHSAKEIGVDFLYSNRGLKQIIIPDDAKIGGDFLNSNSEYRRIAPGGKARQFKQAEQNIAARAVVAPMPQNPNNGPEY